MGGLLFGGACALLYLALHWGWDKFHEGRAILPPVSRSLKRVPASVVPFHDQGAQLRNARALISNLVESASLWVASQTEAEQWLADYDMSNVDESELLKRAYVLLFGVESGHKAMPSLSQEHARWVSSWLTEYLGKEERE